MYILMVVLLMLVFPVTSIIIEFFFFKGSAGIIFLLGKWFVFWSVGIRLFTAGLNQAIRPQYTTEKIFNFKSNAPLVVVQELGFANISMGILGIITIFNSNWIMPAIIAGGLFYGLAGIKHITNKNRNLPENVAMSSNLFTLVILLLCFFYNLI